MCQSQRVSNTSVTNKENKSRYQTDLNLGFSPELFSDIFELDSMIIMGLFQLRTFYDS